MDDKRTTDWRALSAYLANAAHQLRLTVVNLASDPNVPDVVRRSTAFLAAARNAELVDVFLERWREAERLGGAELVAASEAERQGGQPGGVGRGGVTPWAPH
jgi:hypothetical protein